MYQNKYPLSAKIFCANHNTVFHRRKLSRNSNEIVWCCSEYLVNGRCSCDTPRVRESELYLIFDNIISNLSINLDEVSKILLKLYRLKGSDISVYDQLKIKNSQKEKIKLSKNKILELNILGYLSNKEFSEKNEDYNAKISKIDEDIAKLSEFKSSVYDFLDKDNEIEKILKQKISTSLIRNRLIELILNKIVVSKGSEDKNRIELKIFFNFSERYVKNEIGNNLVVSLDEENCFFNSDYEFKRGFDKTKTKRYSVGYNVKCYIFL